MSFDAMKSALDKKKHTLHHGFKVSIELEPSDPKEEEKEKKLGMAPSVKDAKSPKEPKLMPVAIEAGDGSDIEGSPEEEKLEDPITEHQEMTSGASGLPELPTGREPKGLHEMAAAHMMKHKPKHK